MCIRDSLSPEKRGAHAPELLTLPNSDEMKELLDISADMHVHVSLAPELKGGIEFIKFLSENNATAGIAHTAATYEEAMTAVKAGAISFTHTFNAMTEMLHRAPGVAGAALSSGRYAEFICDGVHVHPAVIKAAYNSVPHDKFVPVSYTHLTTQFAGYFYSQTDGFEGIYSSAKAEELQLSDDVYKRQVCQSLVTEQVCTVLLRTLL